LYAGINKGEVVMKIELLQSECPYCRSKDLEYIGTQEGVSYSLLLSNCTNPHCKPYTVVIAKIHLEVLNG